MTDSMMLNNSLNLKENSSVFTDKVLTAPFYPHLFTFEKNTDIQALIDWIDRNYHKSLYYATVYLVLIVVGTRYMRNKPPLQMRTFLVVWNTLLAIFSIAGTLRTVPELHHVAKTYGFKATICNVSYDNPVQMLWSWLFALSKVAELLDTAFVILRKQKLMFLHWFHHSSVLVWVWFLEKDLVAMGRWFMTMNFTVHSFMYSYYALKALRVRVPKKIAMGITSAQVVQMIVGFYISVRGFTTWLSGEQCDMTGRIAIGSFTMYSFYFALFVNFFHKTYFKQNLKKKV